MQNSLLKSLGWGQISIGFPQKLFEHLLLYYTVQNTASLNSSLFFLSRLLKLQELVLEQHL